MGQRRAVGSVLAGTCALALAVILSACQPGGTPHNAALTKASGAGGASISSVKIHGKALHAPDAIAVAENRVWVANSLYPFAQSGGGWITELSAQTGAIIRVISAGRYRLTDPEAIAVVGNRVWVVNSFGNSVTEFNAATGALVRVISAQQYRLSDPGAITTEGNRVWVANNGSNSVTEINASTGALIRVISGQRYQLNSGGFSVAIAAAGNSVWVPSANGNAVTQINATTGALIRVISGQRYQFDNPVEIAASGDRVWVVSSRAVNSSVTEINATTGALIRVIPSLPNFAFGITPGGVGVWLVTNVGVKGADGSGPDGSVAELGATSGFLSHNISGPPFHASIPGGAIAADGAHIWVTGTHYYSAGGWVAELSAATGALVRVISG